MQFLCFQKCEHSPVHLGPLQLHHVKNESRCALSVVVQVLEGEDAIQKYRTVMGATNPEKADAI